MALVGVVGMCFGCFGGGLISSVISLGECVHSSGLKSSTPQAIYGKHHWIKCAHHHESVRVTSIKPFIAIVAATGGACVVAVELAVETSSHRWVVLALA